MRSSGSGLDGARHHAGQVINDRYLISGFIGKGGMGEVYRADDLKLHQTVALKFLPSALAADPARLQKFHAEVRTARQVSHRAVCRVYDIGETNEAQGGEAFISMEFVDGEDLSSLLRRIGRLPGDKAVEIARQLCAGLAAAHDAGVLHRDLKPANIMLDGQGNVRITDFGLAAVAEEIAEHEVSAGTPAYMAPEQIEGREVTKRSDIYSLGLVLYELFTGKRPFDAKTPAELRSMYKSHSSSPSMGATSLSSVIGEIDPAVERVIMRCLEWDPARRPDSAIAVAASLPGGDPLAAALAAGETPSPELVAQSGRAGTMKPLLAGACVAITALCVAAMLFMGPKVVVLAMYPVRESPLVWAERARDITRELELAHFEASYDEAWGYMGDGEYRAWLVRNMAQAALAEKAGTPAPDVWTPEEGWAILSDPDRTSFGFFYRWSPSIFNHQGLDDNLVTFFRPIPTANNQLRLTIDARGRMTSLNVYSRGAHGVRDLTEETPVEEIWDSLFELAGMDRSEFTEVEPRFVPDLAFSEISAWRGPWIGGHDVEVVVHMAALHGKPVFFRVFAPWNYASLFVESSDEVVEAESAAAQAQAAAAGGGALRSVMAVLIVAVPIMLFGGGAVLAWRNWRLGRVDRKGVSVIFFTLMAAQILIDLLSSHHLLPTSSVDFGRRLAAVVTLPVIASLFYLALEPYARKLWPETLISWSRLATGRWRDPRIGRDLLIGVCVGALIAAASRTMIVVSPMMTGLPRPPLSLGASNVRSVADQLAQTLGVFSAQMQQGFVFFLLLIIMKAMFRLRILAIIIFAIVLGLFVFTNNSVPGHEIAALIFTLFAVVLFVGVMLFFGVLALIASLFTLSALIGVIDFDISAWYGHATLVPLLVIGAICAFGFYTATGGQKLFKDDLISS